MKKRLYYNLFFAFAVIPLLHLAKDFYRLEILKDHTGFSGTFYEYVRLSQIVFFTFLLSPTLYYVLVLLPYCFLFNYFKFKKVFLRFYQKLILLLSINLIIILVWGLFFTNFLFPLSLQQLFIIPYFFVPSIIIVTLNYFVLDKK